MKKPFSDASVTKLGFVLNHRKKKDIKYYRLGKQQRTLKLLVDIVNTDYDTMEQCLSILEESNPNAVQLVRKLFRHCQETGIESCLCGFCKIRNGLNIKHFSVYLWRRGIITNQLLEMIALSSLDQKSESKLWNELERELKAYSSKQHIVEALSNTLENHSHEYSDLSVDIREWLEDPQSKFVCQCRIVYLEVLKLGAKVESDSETKTISAESQKCQLAVSSDQNKRKNKSKNCSTRKTGIHQSEMKDQKSKGKPQTKNQNSGKELVPYQAALREKLPSSVPDTAGHITVDRTKSTQVFNISNARTVNVGNKCTKIGSLQQSETSNDTESCTPNDSESDVSTELPPNQTKVEVHESINVSRKLEFFSRSQSGYHPECELKTSRRRRTVSESALPSPYNDDDATHASPDKSKTLRTDQTRCTAFDKAVASTNTNKPEFLAIYEHSKSGKTETETKGVIPNIVINEACISDEDLQATNLKTATDESIKMNQNEAQQRPEIPNDSVLETTRCRSEATGVACVNKYTLLYSKAGAKNFNLEKPELSDFDAASSGDDVLD